MTEKNKKPNLLKNSMQGAKSRFDERLEKAQNIAILGGEGDKKEAVSPTQVKTQKAPSTKAANNTTKAPKSSTTTKKAESAKPKKPLQSIPTQLDSFKFPVNEHKQIQELILDYAKRGEIVNKSEIIRLGLAMLKKSTVSEKTNALDNLQRVRVGRPPSS